MSPFRSLLCKLGLWHPPPTPIDPEEVKLELRRNRIINYLAQRRARQHSRIARGLAQIMRHAARNKEAVRAAESALEFLEKTRGKNVRQ